MFIKAFSLPAQGRKEVAGAADCCESELEACAFPCHGHTICGRSRCGAAVNAVIQPIFT